MLRQIQNLSRAELEKIVEGVVLSLYLGQDDADRNYLNADREWSSDEIDSVAATLNLAGLCPAHGEHTDGQMFICADETCLCLSTPEELREGNCPECGGPVEAKDSER